jgi:predicted metal-binding protein
MGGFAMLAEALADRLRQLTLNQADLIDVAVLKYEEEIRAMCEMNRCGRYGRSWNCPPHVGSLEELAARCGAYQNGFFFNAVSALEDSFDFEGMMAAGAAFHDIVVEIDGILKREFRPDDYLLLGAGSCNACGPSCAYPEPCRRPDELFIPIEACGVNVVNLAKNTGFRYNNGPNTVTYFGLLMF